MRRSEQIIITALGKPPVSGGGGGGGGTTGQPIGLLLALTHAS